jgi:tetratricopeptide (TPR) repeat protein
MWRSFCNYLISGGIASFVVSPSLAGNLDPTPEQRTAAEQEYSTEMKPDGYVGHRATENELKVAVAETEKFGSEDPRFATALDALAKHYQKKRRYKNADELFRRSLAIREKALGGDNLDLASSLSSLAELDLIGEDFLSKTAESESLYKRSLAIRENLLGPNHPDVATSLSDLAEVYQREGKGAAAEPLYGRALQIREASLSPDSAEVTESINTLATYYRNRGKFAESESLYRHLIAAQENHLGPDNPEVVKTLSKLAFLLNQEGKRKQSLLVYEKALSIMNKSEVATKDGDNQLVMELEHGRASIYLEKGEYSQAEPILARALTMSEKSGPRYPDEARNLTNLAWLLDKEGKYAEAETLLSRALAIYEDALGAGHPGITTTMYTAARIYIKDGKFAEAEDMYKRALRIWETAKGHNDAMISWTLNLYAALLKRENRKAEAEQLFARAKAIEKRPVGP